MKAQHHIRIKNTLELRESIRAGAHTSIGGYAVAFITTDCGVLCHACVKDNYKLTSDSIKRQFNDGWQVCGLFSECETDEQHSCDHCYEVVIN